MLPPPPIHKYPRTQHIEGSRFGPGDDDLESVPFSRIANRNLVVEEKVDGANAALRFDPEGNLLLQSRGHYLLGGPREKQFDLFKRWAQGRAGALRERLGDRFVMYGEWMYAKHTVFYDRLPHYFLEFDILDTQTGAFLDTDRRHALLAGAGVTSVSVLERGRFTNLRSVVGLIGPSLFKSDGWRARLVEVAQARGVGQERVLGETDASNEMEGLYLKVEEEGRVIERYKFVRSSFLCAILDAETHWSKRPLVPNLLADGVDLFGGAA